MVRVNKEYIIKSGQRLSIFEDRNEVLVDGLRVHLTPKEFRVLAALKKSPSTLTRNELYRAGWGEQGKKINSRSIDQHIARIRRKLGSVGKRAIRTVNSYGYVFEAI